MPSTIHHEKVKLTNGFAVKLTSFPQILRKFYADGCFFTHRPESELKRHSDK